VAPLLDRDHFFEIYPEPATRNPNLIIEHLRDTSFGLRIRGAGRPERYWNGWLETSPAIVPEVVAALEQALLALPRVGLPGGYLEAYRVDPNRARSLREAGQIPIRTPNQFPAEVLHPLRASVRQLREWVPITRPTLRALQKVALFDTVFVTLGSHTYEIRIYAP
jgi:hypothetical protein